MPDDKRSYKRDLTFAAILVVAGVSMSGFSLAKIALRDPQQMAQATPPLQGTPSTTTRGQAPAEAKPGGERPTTPAPEPARPDTEAQQQGVKPALPPAPAEKTAAPIQTK